MDFGGRGTADQQGEFHTPAFHLPGYLGHHLQRRGDQSAQSHDIGLFGNRRIENFIGGHHHPQVNHVVIVASKHHSHDVLADVVDIALHRGQQDLLALFGEGKFSLVGFYVWQQECHGFFHHPGRLDDLGQEHFPRSEEFTHDIHAVHQRTFNNTQRRSVNFYRFRHIFVDEVGDSLHQGMGDPFRQGQMTPLFLPFFGFSVGLKP